MICQLFLFYQIHLLTFLNLEDFYVSSSNEKAYDFINGWPKWIKRIVNIFGPSGTEEIKKLSNIIKPHIGVITNIGEAHIENFKNINGASFYFEDYTESELINNHSNFNIIVVYLLK